MASAQDILDAVNVSNGMLDQLHTDSVAERTATTAVGDAVVDTRNHLDAGFSTLAQGLAALATLQAEAVTVLGHLAAQTDTVICLLDQVARNTCAILDESARQSAEQQAMRADLDALVFLYSTVNPGGALELERSREIARRFEACCPPATVDPPCQPAECARPKPLRPPVPDATVPAYPYPPRPVDVPR